LAQTLKIQSLLGAAFYILHTELKSAVVISSLYRIAPSPLPSLTNIEDCLHKPVAEHRQLS